MAEYKNTETDVRRASNRMTAPTNNHTERPWRKNGLLFSLLALLIAVELFTVFAVLASQRFATDRALQDHTRELLQNVVDETRENADGYLQQAQDSVSLATGIFEATLLSGDRPDQLERYFLEQLRVIPQIDALYFGDPDGNFIFSKRDGAPSGKGFLTKIIQTSRQAEERVTLVNRTPCLVETSRRHDPTDAYDPRVRPWYQLARQVDDEVWTDPYIFYTSQRPGLTVARAVRDEDGRLLGVIGADIELTALSKFLTTQRVGTSGAAFIVYSNGDVLAHPYAEELAQRDDDQSKLRLKQLAELDTITARAGARLKERIPDLATLNHTHLDTFEVAGQSYLSMFVPLLNHGENQWVIGVYAPEDEMARTIREGQRESIFLGVAMSLLVITAAIAIALIILRPINTLQRQAREDPLTGLLNRRSFDDAADRLSKAKRSGHSFCAIMIDIDYFKPINDEYGHAVGDEVLLVVARRINRGLSDEDLLSRYGGEEFAVVLPDATLQQGLVIAERLREIVSAKPVNTSTGPLVVTISLGVAEIGSEDETIAELLIRADQGLLAAKRQGRNCVVAQEA